MFTDDNLALQYRARCDDVMTSKGGTGTAIPAAESPCSLIIVASDQDETGGGARFDDSA